MVNEIENEEAIKGLVEQISSSAKRLKEYYEKMIEILERKNEG